MSTKHSSELSSEPVPVCLYLRCSSPQQELSVADQRREVLPYCERKGYRVVREYIDEGKSASKDPEKRTEFNRMIADSMRGEFRVVVCYDASRFTRFDNIEGSTPKQILRTNGVFLDTTKEGEFDWRTPEGRWKDMAFCEANKAHSLNISKDVIRGRVNILKLGQGYWPNGVVPYGYDKSYTDGVRTQFVKRGEKYRKGKGWHLRLVVDEEEAAVIRDIFDLYVNRRWSRRQIATHLTGKRVPPPKSNSGESTGGWGEHSITTVLQETAYIGVGTIGRRRNKSRSAHNRVSLTEHPNACPAIVERRIWEGAQALTQERKEKQTKPQPARCGVLSGFLICGHCGYRLIKRVVNGQPRYCCMTRKVRPHVAQCKHWGVYEADIFSKAMKWLMEAVDAEVVLSLQARPEGEEANDEQALLEGQAEALQAKVTGGTESALLAPSQAREAAWALVRQWSEELEVIRQKLELVKAVRNDPAFDEFAAWWETAKEQFVAIEQPWFVGETAEMTLHLPVEKDRLRALLSRLGFTCTLFWEEKAKKGSRREGFYDLKDTVIEATVELTGKCFDSACRDTHGPGR